MASRKAKYLLGELNRQVEDMLPEEERATMEQKTPKGKEVNRTENQFMQLPQNEREERYLEEQNIRKSRNALELALENYQRTRRSRQRVHSR